jgi:hypothetical protein
MRVYITNVFLLALVAAASAQQVADDAVHRPKTAAALTLPPPYIYRELDHVQVELHRDIALTIGRNARKTTALGLLGTAHRLQSRLL